MDRHTKEQRKKNMRAVKNKDSKIELALRAALYARGLRGYRKNYKNVEGKPDVVFTKYKVAIFADSEFWHGKDWEKKKHEIKSNKEFWHKKIEGNIARDKKVNEILTEQGYTILRYWGKDILKRTDEIADEIEAVVQAEMRKNWNFVESLSAPFHECCGMQHGSQDLINFLT